jgi:hypothetical protein
MPKIRRVANVPGQVLGHAKSPRLSQSMPDALLPGQRIQSLAQLDQDGLALAPVRDDDG